MVIILLFFIYNQAPKETNPVKIVFGAGIRIYQKVISPAQGDVCNFYPSCSNFAFEAVQKYGVFWGTLMASDRLMRCNPNAVNYFDTYYGGIRHGKIYDPPESNFILSPINKSVSDTTTIIE